MITTKAEFRKKVFEEGVPAAYDALIEVLQNPKASPTAKASAGRSIFEVAGLLKAPEEGSEREPHELSADELAQRIKRLQHERANRALPLIDVEPRLIEQREHNPKGVFD